MRRIFSGLLAVSTLITSLSACGGPQLPASALRSPLQAMNARPGLRAMTSTNRPANTLRLSTYNIRNLFDGVQNPGKAAETAKPEKELQALSTSMHDISPDVIGFEEVESKETLTKFRDRFLSDMGYREVILIEGNDERGIDVGLMSRYPVTAVKSHKDVRFEVPGQGVQGFERDLLQVRIQGPNNYNFTVFVGHLKSQHGAEVADVKRRAEAEAARKIIQAFQQANPRENVLVLGDFNDTYNTAELAPLVSPQNGLGLVDIIHQDLGAGPEVYSYHPKQYRSRIDYMLLNQNMLRDYIPRSVTLHKPFKEGDAWKKLYFYDASDHIPVTLDLNIAQDK